MESCPERTEPPLTHGPKIGVDGLPSDRLGGGGYSMRGSRSTADVASAGAQAAPLEFCATAAPQAAKRLRRAAWGCLW